MRAGSSLLQPQLGLVLPMVEPKARHAIGLICSTASASVAETSKRLSGEGTSGVTIPNIIPLSAFTKNIFDFSLKSVLDTIEDGQFEQAQSMRVMADYTLNVSRLSGLDVSEFEANFNNIFKVLDAWNETEKRGVIDTFELEVINRRTELNTIFGDVKLQRDYQHGAVNHLQRTKDHIYPTRDCVVENSCY